jgi:hypothetical protein
MDAGIARLAVAGVLGAHGIGHALGWMPAWGIAKFEGMSSHSWLVSGFAGESAARLLAGAIFLVPTVGFIAAAAGLLTGQPWWRQAAVASATTSILCTALFPQAFTTSSTVGSVAVDIAVLIGILVMGWGGAQASQI